MICVVRFLRPGLVKCQLERCQTFDTILIKHDCFEISKVNTSTFANICQYNHFLHFLASGWIPKFSQNCTQIGCVNAATTRLVEKCECLLDFCCGTGTVLRHHFHEFVKMMSKNGTSTAAEIKETFTLFNKSGSGSINAADLGAILTELGDPATGEEVQEMIVLADISKSGGVNFADFETIMLD